MIYCWHSICTLFIYIMIYMIYWWLFYFYFSDVQRDLYDLLLLILFVFSLCMTWFIWFVVGILVSHIYLHRDLYDFLVVFYWFFIHVHGDLHDLICTLCVWWFVWFIHAFSFLFYLVIIGYLIYWSYFILASFIYKVIYIIYYV